MFKSPLRRKATYNHNSGVYPHVTKVGTQLPLITPLKVKMAQPFPTELHISNNKNRVEWIKRFLTDVTALSSKTGDLSLEDKIERLQRRLGGKPLQIDNALNKIDQSKNM